MCFLIFIFMFVFCGASNINIFVLSPLLPKSTSCLQYYQKKKTSCLQGSKPWIVERVKRPKRQSCPLKCAYACVSTGAPLSSRKRKDKQIWMKRTVTVTVTLRPGEVGPTYYSRLMLMATNPPPTEGSRVVHVTQPHWLIPPRQLDSDTYVPAGERPPSCHAACFN